MHWTQSIPHTVGESHYTKNWVVHKNEHLTMFLNLKQNQWTPGTTTQIPTATQPRSYTVETKDGALYQEK